MLPLLGQKLALAHPGSETALISACIITAQLVTIPTALMVGWKANSWGRKALLLIGFAAPRFGECCTRYLTTLFGS